MKKYGVRHADALLLVDEARYIRVEGAKISNLTYIYNASPDVHEVHSPMAKGIGSKMDNTTVFYAGALHEDRD